MTKLPGGEEDTFRTIDSPVSASILVLGSKFIAHAANSRTEEEFTAILRRRSNRNPDASHHCWAYCLGQPGDLIEKSSDAGEPAGAAGRPILDTLRRAKLENAVCVVSRYFGGTKLGAGGLARAYADAAGAAIAAASIIGKTIARQIEISFAHEQTGLVYRVLGEFGLTLHDARYNQRVHGMILVPVSSVAAFHGRILELVPAGIEWSEGDVVIT